MSPEVRRSAASTLTPAPPTGAVPFRSDLPQAVHLSVDRCRIWGKNLDRRSAERHRPDGIRQFGVVMVVHPLRKVDDDPSSCHTGKLAWILSTYSSRLSRARLSLPRRMRIPPVNVRSTSRRSMVNLGRRWNPQVPLGAERCEARTRQTADCAGAERHRGRRLSCQLRFEQVEPPKLYPGGVLLLRYRCLKGPRRR